MSNSLTTTLYVSTFTAVQSALRSGEFDPEETLFTLFTDTLGFEPSFDLYEQVSMAFGLA